MTSGKMVESLGIAVVNMIKLQQKKIVALTLHIVEKDKAITILEKRILQIEKRLKNN